MTANDLHTASNPFAPLYWMAFGAFAIGTEGFMVAAILPDIAADLSVRVETAGQLVAVFAITYAVSSPILTAVTGGLDRRRLLLLSMAGFSVANLAAAIAPDFAFLMAARVLLAVSAGLYMPNANALAGALVPPERRGRALAVVTGGISLAVALGVPLGAVIGDALDWRATFYGVAGLAAISLLGLLGGLPRDLGRHLPVAGLRQRIAVARDPAVLLALLVTTLWAVGGFAVYTYVAPLLDAAAGLDAAGIGLVLFLWGAAAFVGLPLGGRANDRFGSRLVIRTVLPVTALSLVGLSLTERLVAPAEALLPVLTLMVVWGASGWSFAPAQQARLIGLTGLHVAPIVLSLNASFQYLGFSLGAILGSVVLAHGGTAELGWVGGLCTLAALTLNLALGGARRPSSCTEPRPA